MTIEVETPGQEEITPPPSGEVNTGLDFIPDDYKEKEWITKYKSKEDFFKGVENLNKLIGQKQIVQGVELPGADATDEDYEKFYSQVRPESKDKYELKAEIENPKINIDDTAEAIKEIAFKNGLTQRQAQGIFNEYVNILDQGMPNKSLSDVVEELWKGNDEELATTNKGFEFLGSEFKEEVEKTGNLNNPLLLKVVNKLGNLLNEDTLPNGGTGSGGETKEEILAKAKEIMQTALYKSGDRKTNEKVQQMYERAHSLS